MQERNSDQNIFVNESIASLEFYKKFGKLKEVDAQHSRRVVENLVETLFEGEHCLDQVSGLSCLKDGQPMPCESMDRRLKQWYDTLRDRAKVQKKISQRTGRSPVQMLCNLPVSTESRYKGNVLRLMDLASRMNPVAIKGRQYGVLAARRGDSCQSVWAPEVRQTVPQPERDGRATVEITGLAKQTKAEVLGTRDAKVEKDSRGHKWLNSKVLEKSLTRNKKNISRVMDFFPLMNNLEVLGEGVLQGLVHTPNVDLVQQVSLKTISSTTEKSSVVEPPATVPKEVKPQIIDVGIKINEQSYVKEASNATQVFPSFSACFECAPFERQVQELVRLENIGRKVITCQWRVEPDKQNVRNKHSESFFISHVQFKLFPGDAVNIRIMFQPRSVFVQRLRCVLQMSPKINRSCHSTLVLALTGKSVPAPEYFQKIAKPMKQITDKSGYSIGSSLANRQAELVPLLSPTEQLCPYERQLDEREVFNSLNLGYHCERFDDIETLRSSYNGLKLPREPPWDLRIDSIKQLILRLPKMEDRESHFQALLEVLDSLGRGRDEPLMDDGHGSEQERSRLIYVRGCVANGIEEWEDLMDTLQQSCLKVEMTRFLAQEEAEEEGEKDGENSPWLQLKRSNPALYVLKKLRGRKYYRDALYIHTYTQLCDVAENVVSVIESTRII